MAPPRDPELTRQHILQVTAEEMRTKGYKAASLSDILQKAGVSKGGLYHHFANKQELGYAVFEEVYTQEFLKDWEIPMSSENPLDALCAWMEGFSEQVTLEMLQEGCPVSNIATEMACHDEGFRKKAFEMFEKLQERLAVTLRSAQERGQMRESHEAGAVASFIVATIQGSMMQGKYALDLVAFKSTVSCMVDYIRSLKSW